MTIKKEISNWNFTYQILGDLPDQIHFLVNGIKVTFFEFPYQINANVKFDDIINVPDLLTLAAMKAFALGKRGKWKDYVDLYFIIKDHYSIDDISNKAKTLFQGAFNPLLFKKQLCYFDDINYGEIPVYMPGFEVSDEEIKAFLIEVALA